MLENSPAHFLEVLKYNPAHSVEGWTIIQPTLSEHFLPQQLPAVLTCELLSISPIDFAIVYFVFPFPSNTFLFHITLLTSQDVAHVTISIRVNMHVSMNINVLRFCTFTSSNLLHCNCKGSDWIGGSIVELVGLPPLLAERALPGFDKRWFSGEDDSQTRIP